LTSLLCSWPPTPLPPPHPSALSAVTGVNFLVLKKASLFRPSWSSTTFTWNISSLAYYNYLNSPLSMQARKIIPGLSEDYRDHEVPIPSNSILACQPKLVLQCKWIRELLENVYQAVFSRVGFRGVARKLEKMLSGRSIEDVREGNRGELRNRRDRESGTQMKEMMRKLEWDENKGVGEKKGRD
jgi:hypothetical protein